MNGVLQPFLLGTVVTACAMIGIHFVQAWKRTRDALFLSFAIAFWLFGANWGVLAILQLEEGYPVVYLLRLLGFGIIIAGVIAKNRFRAV